MPIRRDNTETDALIDVINERARQIHDKGHTADADDANFHGDLARMASAYAISAAAATIEEQARRELVRAGALILAEIERLDRRGMP